MLIQPELLLIVARELQEDLVKASNQRRMVAEARRERRQARHDAQVGRSNAGGHHRKEHREVPDVRLASVAEVSDSAASLDPCEELERVR